MYENATRSYQQASFLTETPIKLILMCYEGAISNLKTARERYAANDYDAKGRALGKAMDIIYELNCSLDMNRGREIAWSLRALYLFMIKALTEADLKKDLHTFDRVIIMLEDLESQWQEIARGASAGHNRQAPLKVTARTMKAEASRTARSA